MIDEPAAEVVRRIFRLTAEGIGYNKIAKIFRAEKVLNPIAYFNQHNPEYFKSDYWRKEFDWHVTSVRVIPNELIDKIVVHHKEVADDGRVYQQIEIYYRFIGKLEHAAESKNAA